jgi:hypothetical protein
LPFTAVDLAVDLAQVEFHVTAAATLRLDREPERTRL